MSDPNVLVYRLGSLGDSIIALPAFHGVRRAFPSAQITLLTNKPVASKAAPVESVLGGAGLFDDVLDYPVGTRNPFILLRLLARLRGLRLDAVFNLAEYRSDKATARDRFFFQISGAKKLYGFDLAARDKAPVPDPQTGEVEWEAARIARRVEPLTRVSLESADFWDLRLSETESQEAWHRLAPLGDSSKPIAFSTGTKVQSKHWGLENWAALVRRVSGEFPGHSAVFLGSGDEFAEAERCRAAWEGPSLNLCGACTPRVSAAVLRKCRLFVGHDSGPMHLAACVGVPCVAVFSARNIPRQWLPRGNFNQILYHRTDCAGCGLEVCTAQKKKCLSAISVDEVACAVRCVLETTVGC
jgi:ADP-heptose:LPS heptosyltransferase